MAMVTTLPPVLFPEAWLEIGLSTALTFAREWRCADHFRKRARNSGATAGQ